MTYDPHADAAYLQVSHMDVHETREVAPNVMIDLDETGELVGVEIFGMSGRPGADPMALAFQILQDHPPATMAAE